MSLFFTKLNHKTQNRADEQEEVPLTKSSRGRRASKKRTTTDYNELDEPSFTSKKPDPDEDELSNRRSSRRGTKAKAEEPTASTAEEIQTPKTATKTKSAAAQSSKSNKKRKRRDGDDAGGRDDSDAEFEAMLEQQSRMEEQQEQQKLQKKKERKIAALAAAADAKANKVGNVKTRMVNSEQKAKDGEGVEFELADQHQDYCDVCQAGGEIILCDTCPKAFHLVCLEPELEEAPEGEWYCPHCEKEGVADSKRQEKAEIEAKAAVDADGIIHVEFCNVCKDGGELICCENCPISYHIDCCNPVLAKIPSNAWWCPKCTAVKPPGVVKKILTWRWKEFPSATAGKGKEKEKKVEVDEEDESENKPKKKKMSFFKIKLAKPKKGSDEDSTDDEKEVNSEEEEKSESEKSGTEEEFEERSVDSDEDSDDSYNGKKSKKTKKDAKVRYLMLVQNSVILVQIIMRV